MVQVVKKRYEKLANHLLKTDEISFITDSQAIIISDDELKNSVSSLDKSGNAQNNEINFSYDWRNFWVPTKKET